MGWWYSFRQLMMLFKISPCRNPHTLNRSLTRETKKWLPCFLNAVNKNDQSSKSMIEADNDKKLAKRNWKQILFKITIFMQKVFLIWAIPSLFHLCSCVFYFNTDYFSSLDNWKYDSFKMICSKDVNFSKVMDTKIVKNKKQLVWRSMKCKKLIWR